MFGGGGGLPWDGPIKIRVLLRMEYSDPSISSSAAAIAATDPFQFDSCACLLVPAVGGFASCVGTCTSSSSDISLWNRFVPSKSNTVASDWKRRVKRLKAIGNIGNYMLWRCSRNEGCATVFDERVLLLLQ